MHDMPPRTTTPPRSATFRHRAACVALGLWSVSCVDPQFAPPEQTPGDAGGTASSGGRTLGAELPDHQPSGDGRPALASGGDVASREGVASGSGAEPSPAVDSSGAAGAVGTPGPRGSHAGDAGGDPPGSGAAIASGTSLPGQEAAGTAALPDAGAPDSPGTDPPSTAFGGEAALESLPDAGGLTEGPEIVVFSASGTGDLGGRAGADAACAAALDRIAPTAGSQAHAFLCTGDGDTVADMASNFGVPANAPVVSLDGTELAASFEDFYTGRLSATLADANVLGASGVTQFLVGCGPHGTLAGCRYRCRGFETDSAGRSACVGRTDSLSYDWYVWGNILSCDAQRAFLCIAY